MAIFNNLEYSNSANQGKKILMMLWNIPPINTSKHISQNHEDCLSLLGRVWIFQVIWKYSISGQTTFKCLKTISYEYGPHTPMSLNTDFRLKLYPSSYLNLKTKIDVASIIYHNHRPIHILNYYVIYKNALVVPGWI